MPSERCRVATLVRGEPQFYCREAEVKVDGQWKALPCFDADPRRALIMREPVALILAQRLQGLRIKVWLEDLNQGYRRIDPPQANVFVEDRREPVRVCLDEPVTPESKWFAVYPANTPAGLKWFIRCNPPGLDPHVLYDDSPILCVERAAALRMLEWAERAPAPEQPKPAAPASTSPQYRERPGSFR